jgi:integrase/recombinase XerC
VQANRSALPLAQTVDAAIEHQLRLGDLALNSLKLYVRIWQQFTRFVESEGVAVASEVTGALVRDFVEADHTSGQPPAVATQRNRRAAIAKLFASLRALGAAIHDPTADIDLPARDSKRGRPLSDREVERCRDAARRNVAATRQAALWALVEAGSTMTELPLVQTWCVDLQDGEVLLPGGKWTDERVVPLTSWGVESIRRHVQGTDPRTDRPLVYAGPGCAGRRSTMSQELARVFELAGLRQDPTVKTESVRAWLGLKVWTETGRIEKVSQRLGLRSTDDAWTLIGIDWRDLA